MHLYLGILSDFSIILHKPLIGFADNQGENITKLAKNVLDLETYRNMMFRRSVSYRGYEVRLFCTMYVRNFG